MQLARLGAGDRTCSTPVFDVLWPILKRFCSRWLQGLPEADDCAQRAIIRVFSQAAFFDVHRDAVTWALELAIWECRTARTQQSRSRTVPLTFAATVPDGLDPDQALQQAELETALAEALIELPATDRDELKRFLSEESAGNAAARKRRQRAIERLKTVWRKLHGED